MILIAPLMYKEDIMSPNGSTTLGFLKSVARQGVHVLYNLQIVIRQ